MRLIDEWLSVPYTAHRLLRSFVAHEIKSQVAGSIGGALWTIIRPLSSLILYAFIFSVILKLKIDFDETGTENFTVYLLTGLIPWLAFSDAVSKAPNLLIEKSNIIGKVHFPVAILPYAAAVTAFILSGITLILLLIALIIFEDISWSWIWLPAAYFSLFIFTTGLVAFLAAIGVFLRDTAQLVAILLPFAFYLTPVLYPISMVPETYRIFYQLNPLIPFIETFHSILLLGVTPMVYLMQSFALGLTTFFLGGYFFIRMRSAFNDLL